MSTDLSAARCRSAALLTEKGVFHFASHQRYPPGSAIAGPGAPGWMRAALARVAVGELERQADLHSWTAGWQPAKPGVEVRSCRRRRLCM